ncbi:MAG: phage tail protein [Clostridia bacterium]|nr:phage tail protein [Clostridia bacterium]
MKIYANNETDFTNNGYGFLTDVMSAEVTEELNGDYYLIFTYKNKGVLSEYLVQDNIVKCKVENNTYQLFRIKRVIKDFIQIEVYAQHIFYDLLNNMLLDTAPTNLSCGSFGTWILSKTNFQTDFTFTSDISDSASARYVRRNPVEAIMGDISNSMVNIFGGDIYRNNFVISLLAQRGENNGTKLMFGKNINEIKITTDSTEIITRMLPLGFDGLMLPEVYVDSPLIDTYLTPRIAKVEFSNIKYDPESTESGVYTNIEEAYTALRNAANELYEKNNIDEAQVNIKIDWVELSKTNEYKNYQAIETLHLGDYVNAEILDFNYVTRVVKTTYNVLTDSIDKYEIGTIQRNVGDSININTQRVEQINPTSILQSAKDNATAQINSALGGYIVKTQTDLYIMDTPDTSTATNVWRWNLNGLGFSSTGINGTYKTAMTADGQIVADMITTGTMSADRIVGIKDIILNEYGAYIHVNESDGSIEFGQQDAQYKLVVDNDGVTIYQGTTPISYWEQNSFTVTELNLGNFAFIPRQNGSLGFRKVK